MEKTYEFDMKFPYGWTVKWRCKARSAKEAGEKAAKFRKLFMSGLPNARDRSAPSAPLCFDGFRCVEADP